MIIKGRYVTIYGDILSDLMFLKSGAESMSYRALYRKFRPQTFDRVKGQDHVVRTLKNQILNNRIGHAYLFTGTRGTGKTSVAKLFARAINCLSPVDGEPCNCCENCRAVAADSFMDIVEIDAASNTGVDDIRRIIDEVRYTPAKGRYKVYIIDEAHMLTNSAFNAFLKTLEEPPEYAVFILATTEPHKLPITILSRCQRYDFHRISDAEIAGNLKEITNDEGVEAEDKALSYIAKVGDGSMRDSISLLDKCITFNLGEKLTYENVLQTLGAVDTEVFSKLFRSVYGGDAASALKILDGIISEGKDISQFINNFVWYLRNLLFAGFETGEGSEFLGISEENLKLLKDDAKNADAEVIMRYIRILSRLIDDIRYSASKQILSEVAFIKLARPEMESDVSSLADRIRRLEAGKPAQVMPAPAPVNEAPAPKAQPAPEIMPESRPQPAAEKVPAPAQVQAAAAPGFTKNGSLVAESWNDIISAIDSPMLRIAMKKAGIEEETEEGITIGAAAGSTLERIKAGAPEIEAAIKKVTGLSLHVAAREPKAFAAAENAFPEDLLKNINFNIGTEDK